MAGKGTISVNQAPVYGDKKKVAAFDKNMTKTPMTGVPTPAPTAGRPPTGSQPQPQQGATQQPHVPPEQATMMQQYAQAFRTNQFWQGVVAQYPSEWSRMYAQEAADVLSKVQGQLRNSTPFFE